MKNRSDNLDYFLKIRSQSYTSGRPLGEECVEFRFSALKQTGFFFEALDLSRILLLVSALIDPNSYPESYVPSQMVGNFTLRNLELA